MAMTAPLNGYNYGASFSLCIRASSSAFMKGSSVNNLGKNLALVIGIIILVAFLFNMFQTPGAASSQAMMPFSDFMSRVGEGKVADVAIKGHIVSGHLADGGTAFATYLPDDTNITDKLLAKNVKIVAQPDDRDAPTFWGIVLNLAPALLIMVGWVFLMRHMQSGGGKAMGFGRSRARMLTEKNRQGDIRRCCRDR